MNSELSERIQEVVNEVKASVKFVGSMRDGEPVINENNKMLIALLEGSKNPEKVIKLAKKVLDKESKCQSEANYYRYSIYKITLNIYADFFKNNESNSENER